MKPRPVVSIALAALALAVNSSDAAAASRDESGRSYPTRPVRLISQFLPGTTTDIVARFAAGKLSDAWGQQVVVDNRPGAGGQLGTDLAAKATPDGYTLAMAAAGALAIAPTLYPKLPYSPMRDFAPIVNIVTQAQVILASATAPAKSLKEMVALARGKPDSLNYASVGVGSGAHLSMAMFTHAAGIKLNHVPYKGTPPAYLALIAGEIPFMVDALPSALPQIKAGKVRGLAVTSKERQSFLPDVPTVAESGYPGFEVISWTGLIAPAKTAAGIVEKINAEMNRILKTADAREFLAANAFNVGGGTREEYREFIRSEIAKFAKVIKDANVRIEDR